MRLLPARPDHAGGRPPRRGREPVRREDHRDDGRQPLPLRHLPRHQGGDQDGCERRKNAMKTISRREFLNSSLAGAGLTIAVSVLPFGTKLLSLAAENVPADFRPNVWLRITPDNMVTIVVNKSERSEEHTSELQSPKEL